MRRIGRAEALWLVSSELVINVLSKNVAEPRMVDLIQATVWLELAWFD
jgi:hypothetical protein